MLLSERTIQHNSTRNLQISDDLLCHLPSMYDANMAFDQRATHRATSSLPYYERWGNADRRLPL